MPVPKHLQEIIGRGSRLTRALHTADAMEADRLSLPVVAEFMDVIAAAEAEYQKSKLPMEWGWVVDQEEPITFFDYEIGSGDRATCYRLIPESCRSSGGVGEPEDAMGRRRDFLPVSQEVKVAGR
jgi:hypothetical protein